MKQIILMSLAAILILGTTAKFAPAEDTHRFLIRKFVGEMIAPLPPPPFNFSFPSPTNQPLSTQVETSDISLSGLASDMTAYISGPAEAQVALSVDGGNTWATSSTVNGSSTLRLRMSTSSQPSTTFTATVRIGAYTTTWNTVTQAPVGGEASLTFLTQPPLYVGEGADYSYLMRVSSSDPSDAISFSATAPNWLNLVDYGDWTAWLDGTVPAGSGSSIDTPPVIISEPVLDGQYGMPYIYDFSVVDYEGNSLIGTTPAQSPEWLKVRSNFFGGYEGFVFSGVPPWILPAPSFATSPVLSAQYGMPYTYDFEVDAGNGMVVISIVNGPEWLKPRTSFIGDYSKATVAGVPSWILPTPGFSTSPVLSAQYGMPYTYDFEVDAGNGMVDISITNGPEWLKPRISFNETYDNVTVAGVPSWPAVPNQPPRFTSNPPIAAIPTGGSFNYTASVTDDNPVDVVVVNGTTIPSWLGFAWNGNLLRTAAISGSNAPAGTHQVLLTLRDDSGAETTQSFSIIVQ